MKIPQYCINFDSGNLPYRQYDYAIVGAGIAGLYAAYLARQFGSTAVINKDAFDGSNSYKAQGGIACVWENTDKFDYHVADTLAAGDGLCNEGNVAIMVNEAPKRIKKLIELGVPFDKEGDNYVLGMEGAHSHRRIFHVGDYTGKAVVTTMAKVIKNVDFYEQYSVLDLLVSDNVCHGILIMNSLTQQCFVLWAKAVILAGGGAGNLFLNTTNSPLITGDSIAMAYRKGCVLSDMEFMQFHPTALHEEQNPRFLISEAVRGEGGILRNTKGERFMEYYHPLKELAPRDIVSRAIYAEMKKYDSSYVYLDVTHIDKAYFVKCFPTIYEKCCEAGIDITKDWIPISPAAHFLMGGIKTDSFGQTSINGLYACGECACTGVHGANRLASNSLLECLVFSARAIEHARTITSNIQHGQFEWREQTSEGIPCPAATSAMRRELQTLMDQNVGIERDNISLNTALHWFKQHADILKITANRQDVLEIQSLITIGYIMTRSAIFRCESRGSHYRSDYPNKNDAFKKHTIIKGEDIKYDSDNR